MRPVVVGFVLLVMIALISDQSFASGQDSTFQEGRTKLSSLRTDTIRVPTMQCSMCEERIEASVLTLKGIKSVDANSETGIVIVTYVHGKSKTADIDRYIAKAGYDAPKIKASAKAKAALPGCCQAK